MVKSNEGSLELEVADKVFPNEKGLIKLYERDASLKFYLPQILLSPRTSLLDKEKSKGRTLGKKTGKTELISNLSCQFFKNFGYQRQIWPINYLKDQAIQ